MALKKKIKIPNGLELEYHRIALLIIDTNNQTRILMHSYLNEEARNVEKAYARNETEGLPSFPYVYAEYVHLPYEERMCLERAYNLLKQSWDFENAEDC